MKFLIMYLQVTVNISMEGSLADLKEFLESSFWWNWNDEKNKKNVGIIKGIRAEIPE